jgi:hypothetical protein
MSDADQLPLFAPRLDQASFEQRIAGALVVLETDALDLDQRIELLALVCWPSMAEDGDD